MSIEDQKSLDKMKNSVRLVNGQYEVGMLWKSEDPWSPDNRQMTEAQLHSLKRKLKCDETFHIKYRKTWYLPHHDVFHAQKKDQIRLVFDAAALHDGVSLKIALVGGH